MICCRDHQLEVAYWSQFKARTKLRGESLQESAAATEQLALWVFVGLLEDFIQIEAVMCSSMECRTGSEAVPQHQWQEVAQ
jgi:hypothetical protein